MLLPQSHPYAHVYIRFARTLHVTAVYSEHQFQVRSQVFVQDIKNWSHAINRSQNIRDNAVSNEVHLSVTRDCSNTYTLMFQEVCHL